MASRPTTPSFDAAKLIETHQTGIWRYLRSLGCEGHEAEDLTQDTFLKVLQKPFEDYEPVATAAYLRKVAHNLFIDFCRRNGRRIVTEEIEQLDALWNRWVKDESGTELLDDLAVCFQKLTPRAQQALRLRYDDKKTRIEIAETLEIGEHGAKNLIQRAKQQLKECIERKHRNEEKD
ncbi:MAG: RNA polymerase sigma factor [Pirellulales bacterium]|jgi:RNA polymerase sigma-70 factor (ECF subfamily)